MGGGLCAYSLSSQGKLVTLISSAPHTLTPTPDTPAAAPKFADLAKKLRTLERKLDDHVGANQELMAQCQALQQEKRIAVRQERHQKVRLPVVCPKKWRECGCLLFFIF